MTTTRSPVLNSGYENVQLINSAKVKNQVDKVGLIGPQHDLIFREAPSPADAQEIFLGHLFL